MIRISFQNSAGEIDCASANTYAEAAQQAIQLIKEAGELYDGDRIIVTGEEAA